jgi:uncharacterized protein YjiS (DUF1127 family)
LSTNSNAPAAAQGTTGHPWTGRLAAALKRWWVADLTWRLEQVAIDQHWPMTDRYLKDIGLTRSEITNAVKGDATRDRGSHHARTRTMDDDDGSEPPFLCPITAHPCEGDLSHLCEEYGCARKGGLSPHSEENLMANP